MKFFEATEGYTPYSKEAVDSMVADLIRSRRRLNPKTAPTKPFSPTPEMPAPLTNEEALPMLRKKRRI